MTALTDFHFLRPLWLITLLPMLPTLWWLWRRTVAASGWQKWVHPTLLKQLMSGDQNTNHNGLLWLATIWTLVAITLAGPSWYQQQTPMANAPTGRVLIMDMSLSMLATDLKPNRLTQARYKALDLLENWQEGDTGLISFAADAYVLSPLTADINNLKTMIPALDPTIMPAMGSRPDKAVAKAIELLKSAGYQQGQLFLIGDEIREGQLTRIENLLGEHYQLSILGVGTTTGGPIRMPDGNLLKMVDGELPMPALDEHTLREAAAISGGHYQRLRSDNSDIHQLVRANIADLSQAERQQSEIWQWHDSGYWLLLLLLPLAALAFRRGLFMLIITLPLVFPSHEAKAELLPELLKNPDQKAASLFDKGDYNAAAENFADPQWQAAALYKSGQYAQAAELYETFDDATAHYNRGNALAMAGQLEQAIEAYNQALEQDPELTQAATNRQRVLEQLQKQPPADQRSDNNGADAKNSDNQDANGDNNQNSNSQENSKSSASQQGDDEQSSGTDADQSGEQDKSEAQPSDAQSTKDESASDKSESSGNSELSVSNESLDPKTDESPASAAASSDSDADPTSQQQAQRSASAEAEPSQTPPRADNLNQANAGVNNEQPLSPEEQKLQRWLEQIPDDPSLLLRNKMQLEHLRREKAGETSEETQLW
jgi:Ca-activated chloride channel family protein